MFVFPISDDDRIYLASALDALRGLLPLHEEARQRRRAREAELLAHVREAKAAHERLVDLVRYSRGRLFDEGLLSEAEYAVLVAEIPGSVARLEGYDALRLRVEALQAEVDRLRAERAPVPVPPLSDSDAALEDPVDDRCEASDTDPCRGTAPGLVDPRLCT